MTTLPEKATYFFQNTYELQSFPVFVVYLLSILLIPVWKRLYAPFELKKVMIVYNIVCVLLSVVAAGLLFYGAIISGAVYAFTENYYVKTGLMVYTVSKNVELLDTLFMILRHKWRQISFLHVFHHSTILVLGNYAWIYAPFPPVAIVIGLNSVVHIFLYAYYANSAVSSSQQPTWKKRLTQFQIAQFVFDLFFSIEGYLHHGFCIYSIMYGSSMMILFGHFYYIAYIKKKPDAKKST
ncbi:elongation of very long chain fatty acids protein 4-like [Hydractinia symbiolongicarpus]|uniref:elongation of very long chain fatty acids protein 4-like n=1 Tax=Hydractinia symbiolongicarpus TaxID=13093 RepID=UPI00254FFB6C|nr:elongation of very long chain fatty acids protein 4-like [Hydractinia symbiolongicarpus]